jgi:hypothetical protein
LGGLLEWLAQRVVEQVVGVGGIGRVVGAESGFYGDLGFAKII